MAKNDKSKAVTVDENLNLSTDEETVESKAVTVDEPAESSNDHGDSPVSAPEVENVIVTVPRPFRLTLDNGFVLQIGAGVQSMEKAIAEHWYAKANGVVEFNPDAAAAPQK